MARKVNPNYRILGASSSMFARDVLEPHPESYRGLLDGLAHHPYAGVSDPSWRGGQNRRALDDGREVAKRMGLPYLYLTEGGSQYATPASPELAQAQKELAGLKVRKAAFTTPEQWKSKENVLLDEQIKKLQQYITQTWPDQQNNPQNASKVVQYFVNAALLGYFQGNVQWGIGYAPGWTRSNTAVAVMTHLLEDRPIVAEIWPGNELIAGAIFANPRFVNDEVRALPRAGEIGVRWNVPTPQDRKTDATKVAVVWSLTGPTMDRLDASGTLTIAPANDLRAMDMMGRLIAPANGKLVIPFTQDPFYILSDSLSVIDLRQAIASARIDHVTSINAYALSLLRSARDPQQLSLRLQNQVNRDLTGTLTVTVAGLEHPLVIPFAAPAGKLIDIHTPWPGVAPTPNNQYALTLTATVDGEKAYQNQQLLSQATFVKRTINISGSLSAWDGITPVVLDSQQLKGELDLAQYMLNPHMERPTGADGQQRVLARVYGAYDDQNVYIGAAVNEDTLTCTSGQPVKKGRWVTKVELPYKAGISEGISHIAGCGDVLQFSFGFRDRVPGVGRQMDDLWAWKGNLYDTDYSYAAHVSTDGDKLVRLWGPAGVRRDAYQTEAVEGVGPVAGATIKITRDEPHKLTLYEIAIPRSELKLFDPAAGRCRFGVVLNNDEGINRNIGLNWSEAAGVFDYWRDNGSYPPNWLQRVACQSFYGIEQ